MLITGWLFGVAAFTTLKDAAWRLAPSRDGVEDAIHHDGRFYSVTYSGAVEVWEHDADGGVFTSATVTPGPAGAGWTHPGLCRRYLVAAPGGRFMVVLKTDRYNRSRRTSSFKVHVLDGAQWKETDDIGDTALFVGANESCACRRRCTRSSRPAVFTSLKTIWVRHHCGRTRPVMAMTASVASGCSASRTARRRKSRGKGGTGAGHRQRGSRLPSHDMTMAMC
jgi:hypothetical protein